MNTDNTQDGAEPSPASAGSQPVAWAVTQSECWSVYLNLLDANRAATHGLGELVPLYREPQPTLTDEEREAIERLCEAVTEYSDIDRKENGCHADDDMAAVAVARGLMKRMV
jgi:hypothetical protein